jgi:site-specific recombinase XerD
VTGSAVAVAVAPASRVGRWWAPAPSLVEAWQASLGSRNTRDAYLSDFEQFGEHVRLSGVEVLGARRVDVDSFRVRLVEVQGRRPSSVTRALSAISSFYEYCIDVGALENNPTQRVKRPRSGEGHVVETPGMPWVDVLRLVDAARNLDERALLVVCGYMGLRVSEALALDVDCIRVEGEHSFIVVVGKGGSVDRCPLVAEVLEVFATVRATGRTSGPLILGLNGERMIRPRAATIVRSLSRKVLGVEVGPHTLRVAGTTELLRRGVPLHLVQAWARHRSPVTTQGYNRRRGLFEGHAAYALGRTVTAAMGGR